MADIRIIGAGEARRSEELSGLYDLHFKLNEAPELGWIAEFDEARKYPHHTPWPHARVSKGFIIVSMPFNSMSALQQVLDGLKQSVAEANEAQRNAEAAEEMERRAKEQKAQEELEVVREALRALKFD